MFVLYKQNVLYLHRIYKATYKTIYKRRQIYGKPEEQTKETGEKSSDDNGHQHLRDDAGHQARRDRGIHGV